MKGFSITHNRYIGMKESDISRDQFWPGLSQETYDDLGRRNAGQIATLYDKYSKEPLDTVVDYGCGDARVLKVMETICMHAIGLDICDLVLAAATKNTNAELMNVADFKRENCADLLYSLQVLQHNTYEQQVAILKHMGSILKPTGIVCVHFPKLEDKPWYRNHETCMCFNRQQVEEFGKMFSNPVIEEVEIAPKWFDYYLLGGKL